MIIEAAKRVATVEEYYFSRKLAQIEQMNLAREEKIINLGIGAPDGMPPQQAIERLCADAMCGNTHAYQSYKGTPELRKAFADWYEHYYGVTLDWRSEIQPLIGSKEGILLLSMALLNEGDKVLVPNPGYPTYTSASKLTGAEIINYTLCEDNGWYPDFEALEKLPLEGVKIMWVNYPNMPTGAPATREVYRRLIDFGRRHNILIVNDNPYSFVLNDTPLSILAEEGAMECCAELNSLSKAHNMSGWRIGMIAGAKELIELVLRVKSNMDSGMFRPLQTAAAEALACGDEWYKALNGEYAARKAIASQIFDTLNVNYNPQSQGLFLWGRLPEDLIEKAHGINPEKCAAEVISDVILEQCGVFITPGFIFGSAGNNYLRISLCASQATLRKVVEKIKNLKL